MYNFRIFNIFHVNEEPDRFIKACFLSKKNNNPITIFQDKYFDFMYEDDFIKIVKFYIDNCNTQEKLEKTINICYEEKFKLSDIAKLIVSGKTANIKVTDSKMDKNYSGDCEKLNKLDISIIGLKESLKIYEQLLVETLP